jgi:predicted nucleic acid-binding protein
LIDQPDFFIAATAIQHNLMLVSRNLRDYDCIPTLKSTKQANSFPTA